MGRRKPPPPETPEAAIREAAAAGADEVVLRRLLEDFAEAKLLDRARRPPLSAARLGRVQARVRSALRELGVTPAVEPPLVKADDYGIIAALARASGAIDRALHRRLAWTEAVEEAAEEVGLRLRRRQGRPPGAHATALIATLAEYLRQTTGRIRWEIVATLVGSDDALATRKRANLVKPEARRALLEALLTGQHRPLVTVETEEPTHL
jgi:hypothetical protein